MIEQIMIFMLGALSAGLLALLLLPAFWRRALRLTRRRLEMLMPLSMDEVVAERDLLRAEFAAEKRRLEQRMEAQAETQAQELVELGRRATEIVGLQNDLTKLRGEHADLNVRHDTTVRELAEANGERSALIVELNDATGLHQAIRAQHDALSAAHEDLQSLAEDRRVAIVALETRQEGLSARLQSLEAGIEAHARTARNETERAQGLMEERDMLRKDMRSAEQMTQAAQGRFEAERERISQMQAEVEKARADLDAARETQRQAERARDAAVQALGQARGEADDLQQRLAAARDDAKNASRSAADRAEELRAEIARLTGALAAAREARGGDAEMAQLREAIVDIGARVARMGPESETRKPQ
ncbi:MAG: hypothetical protein H6872_02455 [Methylobacteriaceae bacterium]|nr:hypothetical protein [Methylobacteriaceae bacterium]